LEVVDEGVAEHRRRGLVGDHPVQQISDDDEEVGAQRVALPEATTALDPRARDAVEEHGSACHCKLNHRIHISLRN
jgi:hypothetical protein